MAVKSRKTKKFADERRFLITQVKRFDYGRELLSRIIAPISFVIAVFTLLKVYNISLTLNNMIIIVALAIISMFVLGYVWDALGFVEEEIEYTNERNRFVKAMIEHMGKQKPWVKLLRKSRIN